MNQFTTLQVPDNVARQKAYVRKIVEALNQYDNLIYDNCDEPDCCGNIPAHLANPWLETMLDELIAADTRGHMIAQTHIPSLEKIGGKDWCRDARGSWTNAEYLRALRDIDAQYSIDKPYVQIETLSPGENPAWKGWWSAMGLVIAGDNISASRIHAWAFLVGGGGGFLEWSAHYHPGAPSDVPPQSAILLQKKLLKDFLLRFDFTRMYRFTGFHGAGKEPSTEPSAWATAIAESGRQYALYLNHSHAVCPSGDWYNGYYSPVPGTYRDSISLDVPAGSYMEEWVDPATGVVAEASHRRHAGGALDLRAPAYSIDMALALIRDAH